MSAFPHTCIVHAMFANEAKVYAADISLSLLPDALGEFDSKSSVFVADFSFGKRPFSPWFTFLIQSKNLHCNWKEILCRSADF